VKFVEAYAAEGIRIHQLHIQNEPVSSQKFPSCVITGEEFARFIGRHLGPVLEKSGLPVELWLGTLNGPETDDRKWWTTFNDYAFTVMEDPAAARHIRSVSYQWAGKYAVWKTRLAYPDLPLIHAGVLTNNTLDIAAAFLLTNPGSTIDFATAGQINLLVVPEPSTVLVLMSGAGMLAMFRRRRQS